MFRLRLFRNLHSALWLLFVAAIPFGFISLCWANKTGLPEHWREALEMEISKHGAHVEIGALTYIPLRGFLAWNVRIYAEKERTHEISRLERASLVLDNARLAAGEFRLRKIELRNARLLLPVDPKNPSGESLDFTGINGTIHMPDDRTIRTRDARATVGGIALTLSANILGKDPSKRGPDDDKNEGRRRELIARIIRELRQWDFGTGDQPTARVDLTGDLTDKKTIRADFIVRAPSIQKKQYRLRDCEARGSLADRLLSIDSLAATDTHGKLSGRADYLLTSRTGRFETTSSINIPHLLRAWLDTPFNLDLISGGTPQISAEGDFSLPEDAPASIRLTGHALSSSIKFRGISFESLDTLFSWQDGKLFLPDLTLTRRDGTARAKALVTGEKLHLAIHSTLPATLYGPFFSGQPLANTIASFTGDSNPSTEIKLVGTSGLGEDHTWAYSGSGTFKNFSYKGVPLKSATCSFDLDNSALDFHTGKVVFDYTGYDLHQTFGGPSTGTATFERARYDHELKTVTIRGVSGAMFPAPFVRLFSSKIADGLEKYRFHSPPALTGEGIVDTTPAGRTDLMVTFSTEESATYDFLGKDLTIAAPSATVHIDGPRVAVDNLELQAFGGPVSGRFTHSTDSGLSGDLNWSGLSMSGISDTYGFAMKGGGLLTGRLDFSLIGGKVGTMDGEGLVALEKAELFSVPILGPLSNVVSKVLDNERAGFQRARSAFCTFRIRDGILSTRDFQTATKSVTFAGDGSVDLAAKTVDFTIRLNARGLLGLITLPLRPFFGLFQFRGTGPLKDTTWENVHFTSPPDVQNEILTTPPRALVIPE